ncbi:CD225/dispanin family protein, partial [Mycobacterium sp.]
MTEPPLPPSGYPPAGYPPPQPAGQAPSNYLVWSILVTIFCCIPFGIVAIVKSSQVNGLWAQGRYAEAQASADSAKKWVIWSVVVGLIVNAIIITVNLMN